jgi:hypothetical protein
MPRIGYRTHLADKEVPMNLPRADELPCDWTKLPENLRYLAGPAEKFGRFQFDNRIVHFFDHVMTLADKDELVRLGVKMADDFPRIEAWLDEYNMTKHREAALVYFTMHLLALGNDLGVFADGSP